MKKLIKTTIIILFFNTAIAQNIINVNSTNTSMDVPAGTYLKDIDHTFDPFLGTWKYQNGNEILIIKLEKVEQHLDAEYGTYEDFIKGNYSYSTDGGATYVVNTILQNIGNNDPLINPLFSSGPITPSKINFLYIDVIYQKDAWATFTFQNNNYQQLHLKLDNISRGYVYPETPPSPAFSIPNNVVLTKQ